MFWTKDIDKYMNNVQIYFVNLNGLTPEGEKRGK